MIFSSLFASLFRSELLCGPGRTHCLSVRVGSHWASRQGSLFWNPFTAVFLRWSQWQESEWGSLVAPCFHVSCVPVFSLSPILPSRFPRERHLMRLCAKVLLVWDTLWWLQVGPFLQSTQFLSCSDLMEVYESFSGLLWCLGCCSNGWVKPAPSLSCGCSRKCRSYYSLPGQVWPLVGGLIKG